MVVNLIVPDQTVAGKLVNEHNNVPDSLLRHFLDVPVQGSEQIVARMRTVKELPHEDAGWVQAKAMTAVGVEENCPVVELLPEYDVRIAYRFVTVVHGSASRFPTVIGHTEAHVSQDIWQLPAT